MSPREDDGYRLLWRPKDESFDLPVDDTDFDYEALDHDIKAWEESPEGLAEIARLEERRANPNRLSKRVEPEDMPMLFARAVQRIWDRIGMPCTLKDGGLEAGMDSDEYVLAAAFAINQGLIRHPTHPEDDSLEAPYLFEPGVG